MAPLAPTVGTVALGSTEHLAGQRRQPAEKVEGDEASRRPIESSMLFPKIHRNSMFPARWNRLPCMNIEVKGVTHQGAWSGACPSLPSWPSQTTSPVRRHPAFARPDASAHRGSLRTRPPARCPWSPSSRPPPSKPK